MFLPRSSVVSCDFSEAKNKISHENTHVLLHSRVALTTGGTLNSILHGLKHHLLKWRAICYKTNLLYGLSSNVDSQIP